jgi:hypothetical protein
MGSHLKDWGCFGLRLMEMLHHPLRFPPNFEAKMGCTGRFLEQQHQDKQRRVRWNGW